jgi:hypothetical protein
MLVVGREGFEPSANGLKVRCSTAELTAHFIDNFKGKLLNKKFPLCQEKTKIIYTRKGSSRTIVSSLLAPTDTRTILASANSSIRFRYFLALAGNSFISRA